jgi:small multidrug resistance pump
MVFHYIALFTAILIGVGGQMAFKAGSMLTAHSFGLSLFQPYILLGLGSYFIAALLYLYSLKQIPVSIAFPCVSLSYIFVALLAHFIWREPFGLQHSMALILIVSGVLLLVKA